MICAYCKKEIMHAHHKTYEGHYTYLGKSFHMQCFELNKLFIFSELNQEKGEDKNHDEN